MSNSNYKPDSIDATLSRILANQEAADRKADAILAQVVKTNGRVSVLETWRAVVTARVVTLSAFVAGLVSLVGWAFDRFGGRA